MQSVAARERLVAVLIGAALLLGACGHSRPDQASLEQDINTPPANYKADVVAAMHAYLNDPTAVRDAAISEPTLRPANLSMPARYIGCVRFNAKKTATVYAGTREIAAMFVAGRFDQFIDQPNATKDLCAGVTYAPFPELEKMAR
jgi:hypothetical protein